ncbi:MAG: GyrI-like domain-containing protein [Methanomassiliicoccus sp.]|nr:GyrI-like domain-containing protein [Methanomassiliicoccus sp.]
MSKIKVITTVSQKAIAVREKVRTNEIPQAFGHMFGELMPVLQGEVRCAGPPFAYYHSWSDEGTDMEVGFPIVGEGITKGRIHPFELPAVKAAEAMHIGPYDKLMDTYNEILEWMNANGKKPANYMWEEYLNSPEEVPADKLMTRLIWPIE